MKTVLLSFLILFGLNSQAFELPDLLSPDELATEMGIVDGQSRFDDSSASTVLEIQIHKGLENEKMVVLRDAQIVHEWPTSTGRNQWERSASGRRYFTSTPEGRYRIYKRVEDYWSKTWLAPMSHAQFFNGGIAIHGVSGDQEADLGRPVSGGCVRLSRENAQILWELVDEVGVKKTRVVVVKTN